MSQWRPESEKEKEDFVPKRIIGKVYWKSMKKMKQYQAKSEKKLYHAEK